MSNVKPKTPSNLAFGAERRPRVNRTERAGARRGAGKLTALAVQRAVEPGDYIDGQGLMLVVAPGGSRSWVLRFQHNGKRREYGLGGYPDTGLVEARDKARSYRQGIRAGTDVIADRRARPSHQLFRDAAEAMIGARIAEGKYSGSAERIARSRLETYAYPKLGRLQLQSIDPDALADALRPIWLKKHETAVRVLALVTQVLRASLPDGYKVKGNLANAVADRLPRRPKGSHHAAMPYADLPAFLDRLSSRGGMGALALQFVIHTAARSGEARGASWSEIDTARRLWTVPASRMKMGKEHRVALSHEALAILEKASQFRRSAKGAALVFPSATGGQLSDMTLTKVMRDMKADAVPHGLRSTFRDWAAEQTSAERDVIEACLAHSVGSEVELAYKRTDFLEKRRKLIEAWGAFCAGSESASAVIAFRKTGAKNV